MLLLGLGSNLSSTFGDRFDNIDLAISYLQSYEIKVIKKSSFVIANDTGPAHISAHLGVEGIVLFGHHTTPEKVSIETNNFKAIKTDNLKSLSAEMVYQQIENKLKLIN